jgi:peroxiredoxin
VGLALVLAIVWAGLGAGNSASPATMPVSNGTDAGGSTGGDGTNAGAADAPMSTLPIGRPAPDFALPAADGQTYSLGQFKGNVVVLEFFAPWCPHCQADAPMFNELYDAYREKGVQFLAVSATPFGRNYSQTNQDPITMEDIIWFRDTFGVKFPLLFDKEVKVGKDYGVAFYPTVYIVDRNGNVASIPTGTYTIGADGRPESTRQTGMTKDELAAEIDRVLQAK